MSGNKQTKISYVVLVSMMAGISIVWNVKHLRDGNQKMESKCKTCIHVYPDCPSFGEDVIFLEDVDLIVECKKWEEMIAVPFDSWGE